MLTLKGSILGIVVFFFCAVFYASIKVGLFSGRAAAGRGVDVFTMLHNRPFFRDPFFWVVLIVFCAGGSLLWRH